MKSIVEILTAFEKATNHKLYAGSFSACSFNVYVNKDKTHMFMFDLIPRKHKDTDEYLLPREPIKQARTDFKQDIQTTFIMYDEQVEMIRYIEYSPMIHYYVEDYVCEYPIDEMKRVNV